ncbi:4-(cytidine 5'-diphospho)-2-C-methyl-D-erythritol kinase [Paracoccus fistulariae]|uniref:4-diphosphocytidyl-2-C-methyl-D-erythritol kinase n=1 Tax=Paracoccus fistulariae TaxID=658446 RepID=A0ABY7SKQ2_9RHOB|nr:4-(cytidine 5'-diphospho)-2-C-methyl-D-erythritol kinase [Paracoccus fistulariae]MDB6182169.1 4-(cytidine 5'-diphospho)-2-C-methyl-D-erythritol kinase [Paracoccus fistulariae]WCR06607.1 4-(cytidine 5'-diphospho)-2-C-methyl-D-erythritol kinase [Paracoccus fistulariae]
MSLQTEFAPAKLNLALHVTGRRKDGYHLLDSLVVFAGIGDHLRLQPGPLSLTLDGPFAAGLQPDEDNLCLRAARSMGAEVAIGLTKNLPVASGIGGGSADAAAVLRTLTRMGYGLPDNPERLGADVPVCLLSAPARMQGVGEIVTPLPAIPSVPMVLVNPGVAVPTPQVFAAMERRDNPPLPTIPAFSGLDDLVGWLRGTRNDLQPAACRICPQIDQVLRALQDSGAALSRMSGSGATCFGLYDSADAARTAADALSGRGWWAVATELAQPLRRR